MIWLDFASRKVENVAKATTVTELKGIRIAAISGVSHPAAANPIPKILYKKEIIYPAITAFIALFVNLR